MNTEGLEWFGPPERNTLRPLCIVLLVLSRGWEWGCSEWIRACVVRVSSESPESPERLACAASASPLYLKGDAYMAVESPTGGPNDVVYNNIRYRHYGIAGDGDLIPGFPCLPAGFLRPAYPCPVLSKRRQGVACGVACSIAERAV